MAGRRRRSSRGAKRAAVWYDTIIDEAIVNVAGINENLDSNIIQAQKKGMTLVRTLINHRVRINPFTLTVIALTDANIWKSNSKSSVGNLRLDRRKG